MTSHPECLPSSAHDAAAVAGQCSALPAADAVPRCCNLHQSLRLWSRGYQALLLAQAHVCQLTACAAKADLCALLLQLGQATTCTPTPRRATPSASPSAVRATALQLPSSTPPGSVSCSRCAALPVLLEAHLRLSALPDSTWPVGALLISELRQDYWSASLSRSS